MRIAIIAPLFESVPPGRYGGTERVVYNLTEHLVARGHDVTLFASGDSRTSACLVPGAPRALRLDPDYLDFMPPTLHHVGEAYRRARDFDVIHNHADWVAFPFARLVRTPTISTAHGRVDTPYVRSRYLRWPEAALVSISHDQKRYLPEGNWLGTIYNGIDCSRFHCRREPGDYLLFLGRMSPEKGPDRAIEIAERAGMRLLMAAKVDPNDQDFFDQAVRPLLDRSPYAEFLGEVDDCEKDKLLGGAYAYIFPIDWPEPFGLTMVESMATGTPVIAMRRGSVPEIVEDGVTGFICDSLEEMVAALERVPELDRLACRRRVEDLFSGERMALAYEQLYECVLTHGCLRSDDLRYSRTCGCASKESASWRRPLASGDSGQTPSRSQSIALASRPAEP